MNLKERINDIFTKYSVALEVAEDKAKDETVVEAGDGKEEDVALAEKTLANGTIVYTDADDFVVGSEVFIVNEEGERMPLPDGEYEYEGGGKTVVAEGVIAEVLEEEEEVEAEEEEEKEMGDDKDKEEMSESFTREQVDAIVADAVAKVREEFAKEQEANATELSAIKAEMGKMAAEGGLPKTKTEAQRLSRQDINRLPAKERVAALYEFYS